MSSANVQGESNLIKNFAPSWFASVMGTGILAITSLFYSQYVPFLKTVALWLFYFNVILFFVLLVPWTLRWFLFTNEALADLRHPVISNFYPTFAVALLVLSANFIVIGNNMSAGEAFWWAGALTTILFGVLIPFIMFKGEHVTLDHINAAWFIPPVGLIVIPIAGSLLIPHHSGFLQELIIFINYFGWGAGFFLYISLLAVCMYRFILHRQLPNTLVPTMWITLGPIGAGILALVNLIRNSPFITVKEPYFVFGLLFWGSGIWWVLIAILMTLYYMRTIKLPYAMSWWAFTFPLGAYVGSCHVVAQIFRLQIVDFIGFGLYLLLVFLWSITLIRTALAVYYGSLFK
ncbi:MAG: C4-dicarboxylate ABC transporter [Deltaproteobacteria bacterium]|nr:C4-dicarboxylate ABC transporter [Deltaproteobacteria bacterium]MBN2686766.1 C4-dicarboxylate ABC transporter [Deltaproteobacteria bacterium]